MPFSSPNLDIPIETYNRTDPDTGEIGYYAQLKGRSETVSKSAEEALAVGELVIAEQIVKLIPIDDPGL